MYLENNKSDKVLSWLFSCSVFFPTISYYSSVILKNCGLPTTTIFAYSIAFISAILGYFFCCRRNISPLVLLSIATLIYIITITVYPENRAYMFGEWLDACYNPFYDVFVFGLPLIFIPFSIENAHELEKPLFILSFINVMLGIISFLFVLINGFYYEYMTFSYNMLLASCMFFSISIYKKKHLYTIIATIGSLCIMIVGSRGAMISVIMFYFIYFFIKKTKSIISFLLLGCCIGLFVFLWGYFYENFLIFISEFLKSLNFKSRVIELLLNNEVLVSRGRDNIRQLLLQAINSAPISGYGIFGDRAIIGQYAHNVFLEFCVDFGLFGGLLCGFTYVAIQVYSLIYSKKDLFLFAFNISVISAVSCRLMFSSSYLINPYFYMMIGGFILCLKNKYNLMHRRIL